MGIKIGNLPVANYMTPYPISVNPDVSFVQVVDFMAERGFGNLIVSNETFPKGILTEREILRAIVFSKDLLELKIGDMDFQPYKKITLANTILDAAKTMISKKTRLLVFDEDKLVGIITASDMLRAFRKTSLTPSLEDVINHNIIKCKKSDTVLDAVKILHDKRVGSVIIEDMEGYGIFTERDLLVSVLANNVDLNGLVGGYSSSPLISADFGIKANEAASIMAAHNIKRLGLTKEGKLEAIVTARDIVDAYQSAYQISNPMVEQIGG
ncbi:MAG: cyclic nucleotide-binding/CBS domain-containing protein [Nitrosopumilaceae archaeon]